MSEAIIQPRMNIAVKIFAVIAAVILSLVSLVTTPLSVIMMVQWGDRGGIVIFITGVICAITAKMLYTDVKKNNQKRALIILSILVLLFVVYHIVMSIIFSR